MIKRCDVKACIRNARDGGYEAFYSEVECMDGEYVYSVDFDALLSNYKNLVEFLVKYNSIKQCDGLQRKIDACKELIKEIEE